MKVADEPDGRLQAMAWEEDDEEEGLIGLPEGGSIKLASL